VRRGARAAGLVALLAVGAGCLSRGFLTRPPTDGYTAVRPTGAAAGPLTAQVERVVVVAARNVARIEVTVHAARPALIEDARVASAEAAPCAGGSGARAFKLDDQVRWDRPVGVMGEHRLAFEFDDAAPLLARANAVLDLAVREPGSDVPACVRLPLGRVDGEGEPVLRPDRRWSVGGVFRAAAPLTRVPVRWADDELRVSRWLDPMLVGFEAGWSAQACPEPCPATPELQFPLWAFVEGIPWRRRGFGIGLEGAYGVIFGASSEGEELLHGPRVALHLLELAPDVWPGRAQVSARGLELSLAYQRTAVGHFPPAWLVGLGWVAF
jgi:hypothetical protein